MVADETSLKTVLIQASPAESMGALQHNVHLACGGAPCFQAYLMAMGVIRTGCQSRLSRLPLTPTFEFFRRKFTMKKRSNLQMIEKAKTVLHSRKLSGDNTAGDVACALLSSSGKIYLGVCIDISSGISFCAEHSAIAAMITAGESSIAKIVAVWGDGVVLPPCGRCREFMYQIDSTNYTNTEVVLGIDRSELLKDLLPHPCDEVWNA
jgi:cytidine deaminase